MARLRNGLTLMVVHAHPDDEAIATGGVLARAAAEGVRTVLVTATRGEEGEIHDPALDSADARHRLGKIREEELSRAADILGIGEVHFLGYRDSGMADTPENANPHNLHNADAEEATGRLVRRIRETRPHVIITYDERGSYGHPDHIAVHRITLAAFDAAADGARYREDELQPWQPLKLYYAVWSRSMALEFERIMREAGMEQGAEDSDENLESYSVPDELVTTLVDVRPYLLQKRAAMQAHRTQIPASHPLLGIQDDRARDIFGRETFIRVRSLVEAPLPEDDLFAGLRDVPLVSRAS